MKERVAVAVVVGRNEEKKQVFGVKI